MSHGFDTNKINIDRAVRQEILRNVDRPDLLEQIFQRARDLAFGRGTVEEFNALCEAMPCIFWQPDDLTQRHVTVRVRLMPDRQMIHVCRVVDTIVHVTSAQGPLLLGHEELMHTCGHNGQKNTARGTCLNPAHMLRGTTADRMALKKARVLMAKLGARSVAKVAA